MDFGKFDILIITTMSLAIVVMSMVFPALGMVDEGTAVNASDMPEFNVSAGNWDIVGQFPDSPGTPSSGALTWDEDAVGPIEARQIWLNGSTSSGIEMVMANFGSQSSPDVEVVFNRWVSGAVVAEDRYDITNEGQVVTHRNDTAVVELTVDEFNNQGDSEFFVAVEYLIHENPESSGWIERVPVLGGILGLADAVASAILWVGSVIFWFAGAAIEAGLAMVTVLLSVVEFGIGMMVFLVTTYTNVIASGGQYAAVILAVPSALLFLEFAKIAMIGISLLPLT